MKGAFIVTDTNIFIDLYKVQLLDAFFRLPWVIHTPDFVLQELNRSEQKQAVLDYSLVGELCVEALEPDEIIRLGEFHNTQIGVSNLSITDCAVWMLAEKLRCPLLTGDSKLRRKAEEACIEVHGILYVF